MDYTTDVKAEFWGDLQADLYTKNTAVYLANQSLKDLISTNGYKAHRPILSHPQVGTYTPHSDISFAQKKASKQTLTVDTFEYAAEDIDIVEKMQTKYDLVQHSLKSIRMGLLNRVEQVFLSEITNADHVYSGGVTEVSGVNILDIMQEAEGVLGAYDAPYETAMRAAVLGPMTVAKLRRAKSERESRLGDTVLENGIVGPWQGWNVVQNNNLPWSATLTIDTNPTATDTITISGVVIEFHTTLASVTAGHEAVLIGNDAAATRANLVAFLADTGTAGTNYTQMSSKANFILRRKRRIRATSAQAMAFTGFGDISVSEGLTAATNVWSAQEQQSVFMIRGAIDLVMQFLDIKVGDKEKGFADLPKGVIGVGAETFDDGASLMVRVRQDASSF